MKKSIIKFLMIVLIASNFFAESYADLMKKADEAMQKNELTYVLGFYYDAFYAASSEQEQNEALKKFSKLAEAIRSGKPGLGEYSVFDIHDEWKKLLENSEKYFTEYPPFSLGNLQLKLEKLDYQKKIAIYYLDYDIAPSKKKVAIIDETIKKGFDISKRDDWNDLKNWPEVTVVPIDIEFPFNSITEQTLYEYVKIFNNKLKEIYDTKKIALFRTYRFDRYGTYKGYYDEDSLCSMIEAPDYRYSLNFSIYTKDGNLLYESSDPNYEIELPAEKMNLIESGNYLIKIDNIVNEYGLFERYPNDRAPEDPLNSLENPSYNTPIKNFEEFSIDNYNSFDSLSFQEKLRYIGENDINKIIYNKRLEKGFEYNEIKRGKIFTFVELDENKKYTKEDILNIINIKSQEDNVNWKLPDCNIPDFNRDNLLFFYEKTHNKTDAKCYLSEIDNFNCFSLYKTSIFSSNEKIDHYEFFPYIKDNEIIIPPTEKKKTMPILYLVSDISY